MAAAELRLGHRIRRTGRLATTTPVTRTNAEPRGSRSLASPQPVLSCGSEHPVEYLCGHVAVVAQPVRVDAADCLHRVAEVAGTVRLLRPDHPSDRSVARRAHRRRRPVAGLDRRASRLQPSREAIAT